MPYIIALRAFYSLKTVKLEIISKKHAISQEKLYKKLNKI